MHSQRPLIGLTGRQLSTSAIGLLPAFHDAPIEAYFGEYAGQIARAGGIPLHLSLASRPEEVVEAVDGLVLTGGDDVDPTRYGGVIGPRTTRVDPRRDEFELRLVAAALDIGTPVLGICRGAQLINVARGGTLMHDLPDGEGESHASYAYPRQYRRHDVELEPGSIAYDLYGPETRVNSFHHQAVDRPGRGIRITGRSRDGVVEAIELDAAPVLAVQWHPECFSADPVFDWLVRVSGRQEQIPASAGEKLAPQCETNATTLKEDAA